MVDLPGYDDRGPDDLDGPGLARNGSELLNRAGFWAAHLGPALDADLDEELAEMFDEQLDAIRSTYEELTDPAGWPVFPIDAGGGAQLAVVYRNFEEDEGIDFLLSNGPGERYVRIAVIEGALEGPGISWAELTSIADRQGDRLERARTLLLLTPMLGDQEAATPTARDRLREALAVVGVTGDLATIADGLVTASPTRWSSTDEGSTVCEHPGSTRNPASHVALTPTDLRSVCQVLQPSGTQEAAGQLRFADLEKMDTRPIGNGRVPPSAWS
ncbi:hypothetical protein [Actinoplanes regularis]|uniref:hypothetical protein n=1 Tax=Actinoplanes regularis TaxID=52697 RepID=UPI0024A2825C|nr:hypothetical protein [Actinoplanes regularis]GLW35768.1 hypothetical protein Areg01_87030 [Actinoplanes regularis]